MEAQPCLCLFAFAFAIGEAVPVAQRLSCPMLEYALCLAMLLLFVHVKLEEAGVKNAGPKMGKDTMLLIFLVLCSAFLPL